MWCCWWPWEWRSLSWDPITEIHPGLSWADGWKIFVDLSRVFCSRANQRIQWSVIHECVYPTTRKHRFWVNDVPSLYPHGLMAQSAKDRRFAQPKPPIRFHDLLSLVLCNSVLDIMKWSRKLQESKSLCRMCRFQIAFGRKTNILHFQISLPIFVNVLSHGGLPQITQASCCHDLV